MAYNSRYGNAGNQGNYNNRGNTKRNNGNRSGNSTEQEKKPGIAYDALSDENYVNRAEDVIKYINDKYKLVTTSKLRNMLAMTAQLQSEVRMNESETLSSDQIRQIQYLKLRFVYEAGRDKDVMTFVREAWIVKHLENIGRSKEKFLLFSMYMEALVAYHRFYGGRDM